jgi:membrane protease YdiL (CAAX protease family)
MWEQKKDSWLEHRAKLKKTEWSLEALNSRVWGPWATAWFGFAVCVIYLAVQTLINTAYARVIMLYDYSLLPNFSMLQQEEIVKVLGANYGLYVAITDFIAAILCVGIILYIIKIGQSATIRDYLGLKSISKKTILVALAIVTGWIVLSDGLSIVIGRPVNSVFMVNAYRTSQWPVFFWMVAVFFLPVFEEILFRGFLFTGFSRSRIGIIGAIVITSLSWTLIQRQYGLYELAALFILGVLLGIVRFRTGSLWAPLSMNAFFKFIVMLELALNANRLVS